MTDVLTIDWTRRPYPADTDGPTVPITFDVVNPHGGNWSIVPRVPGEILTAAKYNADRQAAVDNDTPLSIDDYSNTLAEMGAETNPYPGGAVAQATSLAGELERIRWCIHQLNRDADAWYAVPFLGINLGTGSFVNLAVSGNFAVAGDSTMTGNLTVGGNVKAQQFIMDNNRPLSTYWSDFTTPQNLIYMGGDDNVWLAWGLPSNRFIMLGDPVGRARTRAAGVFEAMSGIVVYGQLVMQKEQPIYWGDRLGIVVDTSNNLGIGQNCPLTLLYSPTVVVGQTGAGQIHSRSTARAWARVRTEDALLIASHNIVTPSKLGVGTVRLGLAGGVPAWTIAVATPEGHPTPLACTVAVDASGRFVDVAIRDTPTGVAQEWYFNIVMF